MPLIIPDSPRPYSLHASATSCLVISLRFALLILAASTIAHAAAPAEKTSVDTRPAAAAQEPVLVQAMETELHRAIADLGNATTPATSTIGKTLAQRPYYLSYSVADAESVSINAQYGAITSSNATHSRTADVQVRLGSPVLDNTHDTHRTSALTTLPLPLNDDRAAIERSLWFATNRGYGKALDALEKVKTEQQVRAKEEDSSADFSAEPPQVDILTAEPPLAVDRSAWESRLREISGTFRAYPNIFF